MMVEGVKAALDFPYTDDRARYVLFLTDGFIGNEWEVFNEVDKRLDKARVFSLGVGSSPNRYLLDGLARAGRGAATYVENFERPVRGGRVVLPPARAPRAHRPRDRMGRPERR